jgi:hypothetical protein
MRPQITRRQEACVVQSQHTSPRFNFFWALWVRFWDDDLPLPVLEGVLRGF